jgi:hypothetical protein
VTHSTRTCPVCLDGELRVFVEIQAFPVHCHLLRSSRQAAIEAPRGDIRLGYCAACGMIFNLAFDAARVSYAGVYENSLAGSPRFRAYAEDLAAGLITRHGVYGKTVVEIGCGRAEFLALLCAAGDNRGVGFDPSETRGAADEPRAAGLTIVREPYAAATAAGYAPDLVCCRHVLEHIASPADFLRDVRTPLTGREGAIVFFEVPNGTATVRDLAIWDIIYEHCSYFTAPSLRRLFERTGFAVLDLRETFDDQFLCVEAAPGVPAATSSVDDLRLAELALGVSTFDERYRSKVAAWSERVSDLIRPGRRVVIWGAGSKTVTFVNVVPPAGAIDYVVDVNPRKHGTYVAGTGQQIVAPEFLGQYRPDTVLVMNRAYLGEIRDAIAGLGVDACLVEV